MTGSLEPRNVSFNLKPSFNERSRGDRFVPTADGRCRPEPVVRDRQSERLMQTKAAGNRAFIA
jgi:hypothetical protein